MQLYISFSVSAYPVTATDTDHALARVFDEAPNIRLACMIGARSPLQGSKLGFEQGKGASPHNEKTGPLNILKTCTFQDLQ